MLKPLRQVESLNVDFVTINTSDRGGILSYGEASGITVLEYAANPAGAIPVGLQYNDVEHTDHSRQPLIYSQYREVEVTCGIVGAATEGDYVTDWILASGTIFNGDKAYVGPSGLITNNASLGGHQIGYFLGPLQADPHLVIFKGRGWSREKVDDRSARKDIIIENDPADRVFVLSDGFIKVRIKSSFMSRSQASS